MKLWLDDVREPHRFGCIGWTWAKTADEAIAHLSTGNVTQASLDHDLAWEYYPWNCVSPSEYKEKSGYAVVCWMEENNMWPIDGVRVHSMNPVGKERMESVIAKHYSKVSV
jgi:hypothetical protein